jgi:cytoskeletal protein CcmA (bactofilin family)
MLRMGKTPKQEPAGTEGQAMAQHHQQQQQQPPSQTTHTQPVPLPTPPPQQQQPYNEAPGRSELESHSTRRAIMESESLAREIKDGSMSGFVGGGTALSGEVAFKGMLRVDGHLTGSIISEKGTLIVSSSGRVDADIRVAVAKINGTIHGDIVATERLEMGRTAQVHGDIKTAALIIEQGAIFEGGCRMGNVKGEYEKETGGDKLRAKESDGQNKMLQAASARSGVTGTAG